MEPKLGEGHRHFRSRMDAVVQNMFEINYSQLIQYEILEKLVTFIGITKCCHESGYRVCKNDKRYHICSFKL